MKDIVLTWNGQEQHFAFERITREKLYGKKKTFVVAPDSDEACSQALMTSDGTTLIPSSGLNSMYVTNDFNTVERKELQAVDPYSSQALEKISSTLGVAQEVTGPVSPREFLDHAISAVYALDPNTLSEEFQERLAHGELFKAPFSYRGGYQTSTMFFLQNEGGVFGLVGELVPFNFCEPDNTIDPPEEDPFDDIDDDDLDFEMF